MQGWNPWLGAKPPHPLKPSVLSNLATAIHCLLWSESLGQNEALKHRCWVGFLTCGRTVSHGDRYIKSAEANVGCLGATLVARLKDGALGVLVICQPIRHSPQPDNRKSQIGSSPLTERPFQDSIVHGLGDYAACKFILTCTLHAFHHSVPGYL